MLAKGSIIVRGLVAAGIAAGMAFGLGGCPAQEVPEPNEPSDETVSFSQQIQPIFTAHCVDCHRDGGLGAASGIAMRLTTGAAYDSLVGRPSSQNPSLTLVAAGDADGSLLWLKVSSSSPPVGSRMPLLGGALSSTQLGLIRDWINQGALNN